jgi:hypothetical protein
MTIPPVSVDKTNSGYCAAPAEAAKVPESRFPETLIIRHDMTTWPKLRPSTISRRAVSYVLLPSTGPSISSTFRKLAPSGAAVAVRHPSVALRR